MFDILLTLGITLAGAITTWVGFRLGRSSSNLWLAGVFAPLTVLIATAIALNCRQLAFIPPTAWLASGSGRWISLSVTAAMTLGALSTRVNSAGQRRALLLLAAVVIVRAGTLPFLGPLLTRAELRTMKTQVDRQGVCLQSTPYNCGPAAAVTALRQLGFSAKEGEIGLMCKTDGFAGTADDVLAARLASRYGPEGLEVGHRFVKSVDELRSWPVSIAITRYNLFVDHYVTVRRFEGDTVVVGDPLSGEETVAVADFDQSWQHVAILLRRKVH